MKKKYLQPQISKYDSLKQLTLGTKHPYACTNQVVGSPTCSGSCTVTPLHQGAVGYKAYDGCQ